MAKYVEGFIIPVPENKMSDYKKLAKLSAKIWLKHGALEYHECIEDDVKAGKKTSFPQSVKLKSNEAVIFAWIVYKSRSHRDKTVKKVMSDPRMAKIGPENVPFDSSRMIYGGFNSFISMIA
jgi:uncharacterized protein YbaA (DUF1428 family)